VNQCRNPLDNPIANPVIEYNQKQITTQDESRINNSMPLHKTIYKCIKTRSRRLSFGPEPKSQTLHWRNASRFTFFKVSCVKSNVTMCSHILGAFSLKGFSKMFFVFLLLKI